jgi:hypothetical protein
LYTEPEYKQHKLEVLTTVSKDGSWGVEVTVNWQAIELAKQRSMVHTKASYRQPTLNPGE